MTALKEQHQQRTEEERMITDFSKGCALHIVGTMTLTDFKIAWQKYFIFPPIVF